MFRTIDLLSKKHIPVFLNAVAIVVYRISWSLYSVKYELSSLAMTPSLACLSGDAGELSI